MWPRYDADHIEEMPEVILFHEAIPVLRGKIFAQMLSQVIGEYSIRFRPILPEAEPIFSLLFLVLGE